MPQGKSSPKDPPLPWVPAQGPHSQGRIALFIWHSTQTSHHPLTVPPWQGTGCTNAAGTGSPNSSCSNSRHIQHPARPALLL